MIKNNRKGFTIVELVIVIAVIGILAGVLIPTFSGITQKAKESKSLQSTKNTLTEYISQTSSADAGLMFYYPTGTNTYDVYLYANGGLHLVGKMDTSKPDAQKFTATEDLEGSIAYVATKPAENDETDETPYPVLKYTLTFGAFQFEGYSTFATTGTNINKTGYGEADIAAINSCSQTTVQAGN